MAQVQQQVAPIEEADVLVFNAPPVRGLSALGGFEFELQDTESVGLTSLADAAQAMAIAGNQQPELQGLISSFSIDVPQYFIDIDRAKVTALGLNITDVFSALQTYLGSFYVNDFNKYGRTYKVILQADEQFRRQADDVLRLYVRNINNEMVPLSSVATIEPIQGPYAVERYNLYPSAKIQGGAAPGYSLGDAVAAMEKLADDTLPAGMSYEWTGTVYQQVQAGNLAPVIFIMALIFVFLFLAAQYESWMLPFIILLTVPLALLGAGGALWLRHLSLDIYAQIGLVMLIGLSAKNAILIVEFAKRLRDNGERIVTSAIEAAKVRLRPILMTAFAFIFGVLPLVVATGAGAGARHSLGTAVFGGMLVATILTLVVVPVLYVILEFMRERGLRKRRRARRV